MTSFAGLVQNSQLGRRTAVVAAAGGILVSAFGSTAAQAAPSDAVKTDIGKLGTLDLNALANEAHQVVDSTHVVTVAPDAKFTAESGVVSVTPASENAEYQAQLAAEAAAEEAAAAAAAAEEAAAEAAAAEATAPATSAPASANGSEIISIASRYVGSPYAYGGTTPDGFDCSGFTAYVYAQVGIRLPHSSSAQASGGTQVAASAAVAGDLVYAPGHIGIYAGGSTMIDSPRPGETVQFRTIWMSNPSFIRY